MKAVSVQIQWPHTRVCILIRSSNYRINSHLLRSNIPLKVLFLQTFKSNEWIFRYSMMPEPYRRFNHHVKGTRPKKTFVQVTL